jgi:hypothetical protein
MLSQSPSSWGKGFKLRCNFCEQDSRKTEDLKLVKIRGTYYLLCLEHRKGREYHVVQSSICKRHLL